MGAHCSPFRVTLTVTKPLSLQEFFSYVCDLSGSVARLVARLYMY